MSLKFRILLFLHEKLGVKPKTAIKYSGVSRATFYRYKQRLNGKMVRGKR